MRKENCLKRGRYYDTVIRLYTHKQMGCKEIAGIIPISSQTFPRWIRNFAEGTQGQIVMKRKVTNPLSPHITMSIGYFT